jgi:uncharacterized damage-inducible protein DinB
MNNSRINHHIDQLKRVYHGDNWVDESYEGKLNVITEEDVFTQPIPGVHSVAEIVWHCIYWRKVNVQRLLGNNAYRDETMGEYNFLPVEVLKKKGWKQLLVELKDSQNEIFEVLKDKTDEFLENTYRPGYTFDFLLEGTVQHDYYHLGQIGLVMRILKSGSDAMI